MRFTGLIVILCCGLLAVDAIQKQIPTYKSAHVPAVNHDLIEEINNHPESSWKAGVNENFKDMSIDNVKSLLGWKPTPGLKEKYPVVNKVAASLPNTFDSRKAWPECKTIGTIFNQARCGSCWAFGCVEAVQDRFCISSKGSASVALSFLDEVACGPCDGCEGGDAYAAWQYVQEYGLVTASCYPYTIPTCPPDQQPCLDFVSTPNCAQSCVDGETWSSSKHFTNSTYGVGGSEAAIRTEIMTNGPVEACFGVYEDFVNYKSGVYQHLSGSYLGGHCIKLIGWGVENGTPYWLANNQWTTYWGNKGQFKILRGSDECGIEDDVVAGSV